MPELFGGELSKLPIASTEAVCTAPGAALESPETTPSLCGAKRHRGIQEPRSGYQTRSQAKRARRIAPPWKTRPERPFFLDT